MGVSAKLLHCRVVINTEFVEEHDHFSNAPLLVEFWRRCLDLVIHFFKLGKHARAKHFIFSVLKGHQHHTLLKSLILIPECRLVVQNGEQDLHRLGILGERLSLPTENVARELVQDDDCGEAAIVVFEPVLVLAGCQRLIVVLEH